MDQQTFSVSPNMSCSCRRERTQQQKQTQWTSKERQAAVEWRQKWWYDDSRKRTVWCTYSHTACGSQRNISHKSVAENAFKSSFISADEETNEETNKKKKTKIKRSRLPVGKVLAAASQEANSRHLTSFEWCDYVWSGPWQVAAAPLCGCVRATNPRQQD